MITFFILLVVLMVLVVAAGSWVAGPRRRVYYERGPIVRDRGTEVLEEEYVEEPQLRPISSSRRIIRRRRSY
ncbi:MAG TPA: hypothetical protein VM938_12350 [Acidimicrobiales bacterium]|nr:hypothetical protein [Acidimicrobiales bacterium]